VKEGVSGELGLIVGVFLDEIANIYGSGILTDGGCNGKSFLLNGAL
jgi:hypothetical protein